MLHDATSPSNFRWGGASVKRSLTEKARPPNCSLLFLHSRSRNLRASSSQASDKNSKRSGRVTIILVLSGSAARDCSTPVLYLFVYHAQFISGMRSDPGRWRASRRHDCLTCESGSETDPACPPNQFGGQQP